MHIFDRSFTARRMRADLLMLRDWLSVIELGTQILHGLSELSITHVLDIKLFHHSSLESQ